jgi:hypothetical protein
MISMIKNSHEKNLHSIENELESIRQRVITSRSDASVEAEAMKSFDKLNALYLEDRTLFTAENIRWANVLRGFLAQRIEALKPKRPYTPIPKRKGDTLAHCWRCETVVDERFIVICPTCTTLKGYRWRACPVCNACGCQRDGVVLV